MAQDIKVGVKQLVADARKEIEEITAEDAIKLHGDDGVVIVDLRDVRELQRDGRIPGAFHCPRGMLEFWIDPDSPYHKDVFDQDKTFLFHCASGWRSALATQAAQKMGLEKAVNMDGGFSGWKKAGGPVETPDSGSGKNE